MRKQYYKCIKLIGDEIKVTYWHTSKPIMIMNLFDFIIPLGTKKPRNINTEEIKEA